MACEKCQGLKKGEKVKRLALIRVLSVDRELLIYMDKHPDDCEKEGFPDLTTQQFIAIFCAHNKCIAETEITRIEFEHYL